MIDVSDVDVDGSGVTVEENKDCKSFFLVIMTRQNAITRSSWLRGIKKRASEAEMVRYRRRKEASVTGSVLSQVWRNYAR